MFTEIKNFLPDPSKVREYALSLKYKDLYAYDGEVYKRIVQAEVPGLREGVEKIMGPCLFLGQGFRLNYGKELPNHAIHIDVGWGTHALVCYLSVATGGFDTGTAFYESTDGNELPKALCHEEFNKAVIYRSDQPHSRWPLEAYGEGPEDGRLIAVAFFTPLSEL